MLGKRKIGWEERDGQCEFTGRYVRIVVHRFIGCGDKLFFTCHELRITQYPLHTTDMKKAKKLAVKFCRMTMQDYRKDITLANKP